MDTYFAFGYDYQGFGQLQRFDDLTQYGTFPTTRHPTQSWLARTGSIRSGRLVNAINPGIWTIRESVTTDEPAMTPPGHRVGWKARLYDEDGQRTSFLIHPDADQPGTLGCIGIQRLAAWELYHALTFLFGAGPQGDNGKPIPFVVTDLFAPWRPT